MSIINLSGTGAPNNKLYLITINTDIDNTNVTFCFYSTKKITDINELRTFLRKKPNEQVFVFGSNYAYQSDVFLSIRSVRADQQYNGLYIYYYKNDGNGWRMETKYSASISSVEVS